MLALCQYLSNVNQEQVQYFIQSLYLPKDRDSYSKPMDLGVTDTHTLLSISLKLLQDISRPFCYLW